MISDLQAAVPAIGGQIEVFGVVTNRDIDAAFASLAQKRIDALLVTTNALFTVRRVQIVTLASRHALPVMYPERDAVDIGGLMSYASSAADRDRLTGIYVGRVLNGEKPAEMPIMRATRFEFIINLQTARTLGLEVPPTLLAIADEVIE
jgi:putative ABC transport system substrate-binding protein